MKNNKVKVRFRENSNGTTSIRLNYFGGYSYSNGKRKAIRLIKTLPNHLITNPKTQDQILKNDKLKNNAVKIAAKWEKELLDKKKNP